MGLFDLFKGNNKALPETEQKGIQRRVSDMIGGWYGATSGVAPDLSHDTALDVAAVMCAVRLIADAASLAPVELKQQNLVNGKLKRKIAHDHWAHVLLAMKPNDWQTSAEFIKFLIVNMVLGHGALAIKVMEGKRIKQLIPVPAGVWTVEIDDKGVPYYSVNLADGSVQIFKKNQVLYIHSGISLDGYTSISAIKKSRNAVGLTNSLEKQQLKFSTNGSQPSGIISTEHTMDDKQMEAFVAKWDATYGPNGEGGLALLDQGASFKPMAMSMVDSQFLESRKFQNEQIAHIFKITPKLMSGDGALTSEEYDNFFRFTVMPYLKLIEQALNRDILGNASDLYFDFDDMEVLRGDLNKQANLFVRALGAGGTQAFMTVNEIRERIGLDAIAEEWADTVSKGGYAEAAGMLDDVDKPDSDKL